MSEQFSAVRKRQLLFGLISGLVVGIIISVFTQFWWWLPTGIVVGLASGMLLKPPPTK